MDEQDLERIEKEGAKRALFDKLSNATWQAHKLLEDCCQDRAKDFVTAINQAKRHIESAEQLYKRWKKT